MKVYGIFRMCLDDDLNEWEIMNDDFLFTSREKAMERIRNTPLLFNEKDDYVVELELKEE